MPTIFNPKRKNAIFINTGGTVSPTPAPPSFSNTKSLVFDGVDEYIAAPIPGDAFKFATIRSFSFWVKTTSTSLQPLFSGIGPQPTSLFRYTNQLYYKTDNRLLWSYDSSPIYGGTFCQAQTTDPIIINDGNWHHIVLYAPVDSNANRNNISNAKIYVDGVDLALTTQPGTADIRGFQSTAESQIILGAGNSSGSTAQIYLDGNIDEFAYWDNYELLSSEVTSIYNSGTPTDLSLLSTPPNKWYRMGDNSTYQTPQILMPENTNKDKVSNYSLTFDGVGDYVNCGVISDFVSSSAFSVSGWFYFDSVANHKTLFSYGLSTGPQYCWTVQTFPSGELIFVIADALGDSGNNYIGTNLSLPLVTEQWYHICVVYDGSGVGNTDKAKIYINGTEATYSGGGGTIPATTTASTGSFNIGRWDLGGSDRFFTGTIDEVSVYSSALTPEQITSIFNGGEPTTISGATAYWKLGEQSKFTDNWLVPNSALNNYSKYSFNLDGVDDYVDCGTLPYFTTSQTSFSISFWFNLNTIGGDMTFSIGNKIYFIVESTRIQCWNIGATTGRADTTAVTYTTGNWFHFACVYDGTGTTDTDKFKVWINGVSNTLNFVTSPPTSTTGTSQRTSIGNFYTGTTYCFNGNIDEVSVYSSALTPEQITSIYNGGEPTTISGALAHWRMGEDATYNSSTSEWTIPDQIGSNDGTSSNTMALDTLVGEAPNYFGGGLSDAMTIEDRVGDAPNSSNNSVSFNMEAEDINNNVPT